MNDLIRRNWPEVTFLALMLLVGVALTVLQYRWTGELAEAELKRLREGTADQAKLLTSAFDREMTEAARLLKPRGDADGWSAQIAKWRTGGARPFFKSAALLMSEDGEMVLLKADLNAGSVQRSSASGDWRRLMESLDTDKAKGGQWIQLPLAEGPKEPAGPLTRPLEGRFPPGFPEGTGNERFNGMGPRVFPGMLMLEVDEAYLRDTWVPELVARYLEDAGDRMQESVVRSTDKPSEVIYASGPVPPNQRADLKLPFFRKGPRFTRGPEGGGPGEFVWTLEIYRRPGALEEIVATTRRKNLLAAMVLISLSLAAGVLLVRQTRRSRQFAEMQMNFVAAVSHELRTPLTVIRGAAHNIKRGIIRDPERVSHYANLVETYSAQLTRMVEQVMEFARTGQDATEPVLRPLALAGVIREAVAATAEETNAAHCTIDIEIPEEFPTIYGEAEGLVHAFQNLLVNAAKHGGAGGWIGITASVSVRGAKRFVEVRFIDKGPGIPLGEREAVFNPFVRGARAREAQVRGSGLGLSLVKRIVEAHGGRVSILAETTVGTTVAVLLPIMDLS